jgi:hypothetical protein
VGAHPELPLHALLRAAHVGRLDQKSSLGLVWVI